MPVSKAQQKAVNKYMKENYDRFLLTLRPKGRLDTVKAHAAAQGESASAFINRAIDHQMSCDRDKDLSEALQGPFGCGVVSVSLPSEAYECAVAASEAAGEGLPDFVARAVEIQAKRDKASLAMGINPATGGRGGAEAGGTHGN